MAFFPGLAIRRGCCAIRLHGPAAVVLIRDMDPGGFAIRMAAALAGANRGESVTQAANGKELAYSLVCAANVLRGLISDMKGKAAHLARFPICWVCSACWVRGMRIRIRRLRSGTTPPPEQTPTTCRASLCALVGVLIVKMHSSAEVSQS